MKIEKNITLQPFNTFKIDAKAAYFAKLQQISDLQTLLNQAPWDSQKKLILGQGSNILLTADFPGLVIKNELKGITTLDENKQHIWLKIGAGENWHQLVMYCVQRSYGGIENLSLIPGTVGAAPMQNIGAYGVEICSVFESLEAMELATGNLTTFNKADCQFAYRNSIFKNSHKNKYVIVSVTLRLNKQPQLNTSYGTIQSTLEKMGETPSIQSISKAVIRIRQNKLPDPKKIPNAGSFFKNPIINSEQFRNLVQQHPNLPHYPTHDDQVKIPAGWLIEQCGWKGKQHGSVGVHKNQALVLVNHGNATGKELKHLADLIQQSVKREFGISLTPEVNIID